MHHGLHRALVALAALLSVAPAGGQDAPAVTAPPGFKVEILAAASKEEGSWISMTFDPKGRLIVSPEKGKLLRVTLPQGDQPAKTEPLPAAVGDAQGLCWAFDSLYVNGRGPEGPGLYRLPAPDGEPSAEAALLRKWQGEGEQGSHAVVAGPSRKLYVANGCRVRVADGISGNSPYRDYQEDLLLPRMEDPNGLAAGCKAPGGHVLRTDPEGKEWELWAGGLYNPYDLAFDPEGDLFTFDADMEGDLGTPWYAPPQVFHVIAGGEYGWRSGSGKWPSYYHDRLPSAASAAAPCAPTGLVFGAKAKFPAKYQRTLFAGDWANGRILAVHLRPKGATYEGTVEPFVAGKPLPVTDLEIGPDGAMYFITGGRGAESRLYRVSCADPGPPPGPAADATLAARRLRRELEAFPVQKERQPVQDLILNLRHEDRFVRFATRVALERQPLRFWQREATLELMEQTSTHTMLALARVGGQANKDALLKALQKHPWGTIEMDEFRLAFLRIYAVAYCRLGPPPEEMVPFVRLIFNVNYPYPQNEMLNREFCQLLAYLKAPEAVEKSIERLPGLKTPEDELHTIFHLRHVKDGWTLDTRKAYFAWFGKASATKGGSSFAGYVANTRAEALSTLTPQERQELKLK